MYVTFDKHVISSCFINEAASIRFPPRTSASRDPLNITRDFMHSQLTQIFNTYGFVYFINEMST